MHHTVGYCTPSFEPTVEQETLEENFAKCRKSRLTKEHILVMATMWLKTGCASKAIDVISSHMQLCCATAATSAGSKEASAAANSTEGQTVEHSDPKDPIQHEHESSQADASRNGDPSGESDTTRGVPSGAPAESTAAARKIFTVNQVAVPPNLPHRCVATTLNMPINQTRVVVTRDNGSCNVAICDNM